MAEEMQSVEHRKCATEIKLEKKKGGKSKKKHKVLQIGGRNVKMDRRMKNLLRKQARYYNSDDDGYEESASINVDENKLPRDEKEVDAENSTDEEGRDHGDAGEENEASEDENGEIQPGITKFAQGCKAFRMTFKKIMKSYMADDVLGPVLSAHKKLVAAKLAEEDAQHKVKGKAKKEKRLVGEKGHAKPA